MYRRLVWYLSKMEMQGWSYKLNAKVVTQTNVKASSTMRIIWVEKMAPVYAKNTGIGKTS